MTDIKWIKNYFLSLTKRVNFLKFSAVIFIAALLLATIESFKLKSGDVFIFTLAVLLISVLGIIISSFEKNKNSRFEIGLIRTCLSSIVILLTVMILSAASFILFDWPPFYHRWLPPITFDTEKAQDSLPHENPDTLIKPQNNSHGTNPVTRDFYCECSEAVIKSIQTQSEFTFKRSSSVIIQFTYSGEIEPVRKESGLYKYRGGYPIISINDRLCNEFSNFKILPTLPSGNSKTFVASEIKHQLHTFEREYIKEISVAIVKCLDE